MGNFKIKDMDLYYSDFHALKDINLDIPSTKITAFIGPSGYGKSTLLKSLNRMNDLVEGCKITGEVTLDVVLLVMVVIINAASGKLAKKLQAK